MTVALVHLSDYHHVSGKFESHGVVVEAFLKDLKEQLAAIKPAACFLVFSGDLVQAGDEKEQYADLLSYLDGRLSELGIPKSHRILVPGNHDLQRKSVQQDLVVHEALVSQEFSEHAFNDFVLKSPNVLTSKFDNFFEFQQSFADIGLSKESVTGKGFRLAEGVGIYCLNTALCSSGGLFQDDVQLVDEKRLRVDTRSLHKWLLESTEETKILTMHHPLHWLTPSTEKQLTTLLRRDFDLVLFGHEHEQEALHIVDPDGALLRCCAPALFSRKEDLLGYSIVLLERGRGVREIVYRQWTKSQRFVSGVNFSNTDNGRVLFHTDLLSHVTEAKPEDFIGRYLKNQLDEALLSFTGQPQVWVDPILRSRPEFDTDAPAESPMDLRKFVAEPSSALFKAPPQFGLTCLSHFLVKEAWESKHEFWLHLDAAELKPNSASIMQATAKELAFVGLAQSEIRCVVLDSLSDASRDNWKVLSKLRELFPSVPLIAMERVELGLVAELRDSAGEFPGTHQTWYMWALGRSEIRKIVVAYNDRTVVGEENAVTTRVISDLDVLNLHRTPFNCLTLLKASEIDFDESPVNRSEMIKRVLFLLFNTDDLPTYKARPDLKDCEYVLGYFCEWMLKENTFTFSRTHFLNLLQQCCKDRFIDLEVHVVFDVLSANHILISRAGQFSFRFAFWVYYFAAVRMHHDRSFAEYVLSEKRYAKHPELMEFYTGIDRRREDALRVLIRDLAELRAAVAEKCGLPPALDPYTFAQWATSEESVKQLQDQIQNGIQESNLPPEIKDQYADQDYDRKRPYDQSIALFADSSFVRFMTCMRGASRALRNSDYVEPDVKRALLQEIVSCWEQVSMVLLVLLPLLAQQGRAVFDGTNFALDGDFGKTLQERLTVILAEIPSNVVRWSKDDLYSLRMGPLVLDVFNNEATQLKRHELALFLIVQRPRGWHSAIQSYIASIPKNSLYLLNVYRALRTQYRFSYASINTLKEMEHLIRMAVTKHVTGHKEPGPKLIKQMIPKISSDDPIIPAREV